MSDTHWLKRCSPAFRLMIATSWLAPDPWRDHQKQAIREAVSAGVDWADYGRLVVRHRIPALSWSALKQVDGLGVPEPVKRELQQRSDACHMQAVRHALILTDVLKGFNSEEIAVMPLKGTILSFELYGDIGLREFKDLDIMVAAQDLPRAQACLESMGWSADATHFTMTPRQWEAFLRYDRHVGYVNPRRPCNLELHWYSPWDTEEQTARKWTRSATSSWRGCGFQSMDRIDLALYLCSHGSEHAWFRAKWLGDIARMHAGNLVPWEAALQEVSGTNLEMSLVLCLRLLSEAYGLPVPAASDRRLPSFVIDKAVVDLNTNAEPEPIRPLRRLWRGLRKARYDRLLRPHKSRRLGLAALAYNREDFRVLPLPDKLFWAYAFLRPFVWVWRRLLRGRVIRTSGR